MTSNDPLGNNGERVTKRAWSVHEASPLLGGSTRREPFASERGTTVTKADSEADARRPPQRNQDESSRGNFLLYVIYAIV